MQSSFAYRTDLLVVDNEGINPFESAINMGYIKIVEWYIKNFASTTHFQPLINRRRSLGNYSSIINSQHICYFKDQVL